jgi:Tfp pilus assembly protein PilW
LEAKMTNKFPNSKSSASLVGGQYPVNFGSNKQPRAKNWKLSSGISLIEILVVITIFAVLGIVSTRAVLLTVQGSKKTESIVRVRENLNFAVGVIERNIRNANSIPVCPNPNIAVLNYIDAQGRPASFSCIGVGGANGYVASGSARLTSSDVNVTSCRLVCDSSGSFSPSSVEVYLEATDKATTGVVGADVSVLNKIYLRNY